MRQNILRIENLFTLIFLTPLSNDNPVFLIEDPLVYNLFEVGEKPFNLQGKIKAYPDLCVNLES